MDAPRPTASPTSGCASVRKLSDPPPTRHPRVHDGFHHVSPPLTFRYAADTSREASARLALKHSRDTQRRGGREAACYPGSATTMKRGSLGAGPVEVCSVRRSGGDAAAHEISAGGTLGWISLTT